MADFDDFDDFDFKPVTKGLGFHHNEKKDAKKYNRVSGLERTVERKRSAAPSTPNDHSTAISKNDLSSFYGDSTPKVEARIEVSALNEKEQSKVSRTNSASMISRLLAWSIDFVIVSLLLAVTLAGFFLLLGVELSQLSKMVGPFDYAIFGGIFFSVFYLSYFSVLDLNGTIGKNIFGIVVKSEDGRITLGQSLVRSIITLFSVLFIFFPTLIDLQGKMTRTKVVRK